METRSGIFLCQSCLVHYIYEPVQPPAKRKEGGTAFLCRDCMGTEPALVKITGPDPLAWINFWPV